MLIRKRIDTGLKHSINYICWLQSPESIVFLSSSLWMNKTCRNHAAVYQNMEMTKDMLIYCATKDPKKDTMRKKFNYKLQNLTHTRFCGSKWMLMWEISSKLLCCLITFLIIMLRILRYRKNKESQKGTPAPRTGPRLSDAQFQVLFIIFQTVSNDLTFKLTRIGSPWYLRE